jgi:hypothetical protein
MLYAYPHAALDYATNERVTAKMLILNGKEGIGIVLEQLPVKNSFHGSASFGHALTSGHAEPSAIGAVEPASGPNGPMRRELFAQPLANGG